MSEYATTLNYEEDCKLDSDNLHKEWLRQSSLAYEYRKHYRNLQKICKKKHEKLKTIRSRIIMAVNEDPNTTTGKAKPNAADIEAYYKTRKEYKKAKTEWIEAEHEQDMAKDARQEIAYTRKKALEELGFLWKEEYYSIPDLPKNFGDSKVKHKIKRKKEN